MNLKFTRLFLALPIQAPVSFLMLHDFRSVRSFQILQFFVILKRQQMNLLVVVNFGLQFQVGVLIGASCGALSRWWVVRDWCLEELLVLLL